MNDKYLLLLAALAPTAMSLIGIIFAKADVKDFKGEVKEFKNEFKEFKNDVRRTQEELARKIDEGRAAAHKDALEIMRQMTALH